MQHSISERILNIGPLIFVFIYLQTKIQNFSFYDISIDYINGNVSMPWHKQNLCNSLQLLVKHKID